MTTREEKLQMTPEQAMADAQRERDATPGAGFQTMKKPSAAPAAAPAAAKPAPVQTDSRAAGGVETLPEDTDVPIEGGTWNSTSGGTSWGNALPAAPPAKPAAPAAPAAVPAAPAAPPPTAPPPAAPPQEESALPAAGEVAPEITQAVNEVVAPKTAGVLPGEETPAGPPQYTPAQLGIDGMGKALSLGGPRVGMMALVDNLKLGVSDPKIDAMMEGVDFQGLSNTLQQALGRTGFQQNLGAKDESGNLQFKGDANERRAAAAAEMGQDPGAYAGDTGRYSDKAMVAMKAAGIEYGTPSYNALKGKDMTQFMTVDLNGNPIMDMKKVRDATAAWQASPEGAAAAAEEFKTFYKSIGGDIQESRIGKAGRWGMVSDRVEEERGNYRMGMMNLWENARKAGREKELQQDLINGRITEAQVLAAAGQKQEETRQAGETGRQKTGIEAQTARDERLAEIQQDLVNLEASIKKDQDLLARETGERKARLEGAIQAKLDRAKDLRARITKREELRSEETRTQTTATATTTAAATTAQGGVAEAALGVEGKRIEAGGSGGKKPLTQNQYMDQVRKTAKTLYEADQISGGGKYASPQAAEADAKTYVDSTFSETEETAAPSEGGLQERVVGGETLWYDANANKWFRKKAKK